MQNNEFYAIFAGFWLFGNADLGEPAELKSCKKPRFYAIFADFWLFGNANLGEPANRKTARSLDLIRVRGCLITRKAVLALIEKPREALI